MLPRQTKSIRVFTPREYPERGFLSPGRLARLGECVLGRVPDTLAEDARFRPRKYCAKVLSLR